MNEEWDRLAEQLTNETLRQAFAEPVTATTAIAGATRTDVPIVDPTRIARVGRDVRANTTPTPLTVDDLYRARDIMRTTPRYEPQPVIADYGTWQYKTKSVVITVNSTIDGHPSAQEMRVDQELLEGVPNARQTLHETLDLILDNLFEGSTLIWKRQDSVDLK
jgi:hypothetical protein